MTKLTRVAPLFAVGFFFGAVGALINTMHVFSEPVRFVIFGCVVLGALGFAAGLASARGAK